MKIEYEKPKQVVHFAALGIGTIFQYLQTDLIYMKTECVDNNGDEINSVDLATGELNYFDYDTKVCPVDATLYVKER